MKRDCHKAIELLAQRLRASLTDADERRLAAHLRGCEACRAAASDQEFVEGAMAEWPEIPVASMAAVATIRERVATPHMGRRVFTVRAVAVTVAAGLLLAATFGLARLGSRSPGPASTTIASQVPWETVQATTAATPKAPAHRAEQVPPADDAEPVLARAPERRARRHPPASAAPELAVTSPQPQPREEPQPPPNLAEFFALGPPPEEPAEPQYEVERETSTAPDGSSMTVTVFTDPQTGERIAHVVEVVVPATDVEPDEASDTSRNGEADRSPASGELPRGGRIG
jgi:hypothetical protein